jgi:prepilin-type N-terminal cleavage/methylation domain-containing protein
LSPLQADGRLERRGFTLPELVLTLTVIALVAAFAISAFFSQSDMTLHNALRLLEDDIREIQARSARLRIPVDIVFEPSGDGYHTEDRKAPDPKRSHLFPLASRSYGCDAVFEGVRILRLDLKGADRISFDATGLPLVSGSIVIGYRSEARVLQVATDHGLTYLPDSPRTRGWLDHLR